MANHKRGRPKNRRGGCLLCKPQKANGQKASVRDTNQEKRAKQAEEADTEDAHESRTNPYYPYMGPPGPLPEETEDCD